MDQLSAIVDSADPAPLAWTACAVLKAINRRCVHPAIAARVRDLERMARSLDRRPDDARRDDLQARLASALAIHTALPEPEPVPTLGGRSDRPGLNRAASPGLLGAGEASA